MRRLPFTDGKYIMASEHLFSDFRNKDEIMKKIQTVPLSPKTERTMKMKKDTTNKQTEDIHSSPGFSIACGESCDVTVECKLHFFVSMWILKVFKKSSLTWYLSLVKLEVKISSELLSHVCNWWAGLSFSIKRYAGLWSDIISLYRSSRCSLCTVFTFWINWSDDIGTGCPSLIWQPRDRRTTGFSTFPDYCCSITCFYICCIYCNRKGLQFFSSTVFHLHED